MKVSIMLRRAECVKNGTVAGISVYSDGLMPNYKLILAPDSASANSVSQVIQKELFKIIECRSDFELKLKELPEDTMRFLFGSRGCGKTPPEFHGAKYDLKDENKTPTWGDDDPEYQEDWEEKK